MDISKMFTVYFFNFGYTKHFNTLDEAMQYGRESGFECAVINPEGVNVKTFKVI